MDLSAEALGLISVINVAQMVCQVSPDRITDTNLLLIVTHEVVRYQQLRL